MAGRSAPRGGVPGLGNVAPMPCRASVVWNDGYLGYDFGDHPMNPRRLDLTMRLADALGVLHAADVHSAAPADEAALLTAHTPAYVEALRTASVDPTYVGHGLGQPDTPAFAGMYEAAALIAGGSVQAARDVWHSDVEHSVNIAGGLHHAMPDAAAGFCAVNDVVIAIRWLLAAGAAKVAYVDVDVHHGDGVQAAFYDDPRVLTISLHQHPATLFPGTGLPGEVGHGAARGTSVNVALPPGTGDDGWLRAFDAVVPPVVRAFAPDILVTQCGCDTHHEDPLAELALTVDGQRAAFARLHELAHRSAAGKWVAVGGGGYGILRCVPRTWTHLIAEATGRRVELSTPVPRPWLDYAREHGGPGRAPELMGEAAMLQPQPWMPDGTSRLDRSVLDSRRAVFPLLGLDPDDAHR